MKTETAQGTITWFEIAKGELPPNKVKGDLGNFSDMVLVTDGRAFHLTQFVRTPQDISVGWFGSNIMPFEPTHWAFINLPEKTPA